MRIIFKSLYYNAKNFDHKISSKLNSTLFLFSTKKVITRGIILNYYLKIEVNKLKFELEENLKRNYRNILNNNKFDLISEYIFFKKKLNFNVVLLYLFKTDNDIV